MEAKTAARRITYASVAYFGVLLLWWVWINVTGLRETPQNYYFGGAYALIGVVGGLLGLASARSWGGWKSVMGRAIIFLSLGLWGQSFGQLVWAFYNAILHVEVPYPSIADIGYFSLIPFNALAMWHLARAAGARFSLRAVTGRIQLALVPLAMLVISYYLFLRGYELDLVAPVKVFLDFGYPMGEAIDISLAILAFMLTRAFLGGVMKWRVLYIVLAFVIQYVTDYTFLYRASRELYYNAGPVDLMYMTSFLFMTIGLVRLRYQEAVSDGRRAPKN